ncbi:hypothetical protein [Variovorax sp. JS1663]|uniref:hypothetical protein n=1 Tax=Variovorax sp. JS1663 TaxID=1851577 RepID=UPI0013023AC9|nr:hypothetical protein [Variovorax sp. JS1663]
MLGLDTMFDACSGTTDGVMFTRSRCMEIDEFLQDHEEWTRILDGGVLNPH